MVSIPERNWSAPCGGFGVVGREGMGVTDRETTPFSRASFGSVGGVLSTHAGACKHPKRTLCADLSKIVFEQVVEMVVVDDEERRRRAWACTVQIQPPILLRFIVDLSILTHSNLEQRLRAVHLIMIAYVDVDIATSTNISYHDAGPGAMRSAAFPHSSWNRASTFPATPTATFCTRCQV